MYYIAVLFALCLWDISAQTNDCRPSDCFDLSCYGLSEGKDGPHTIYPVSPNLKPLNVSCDQETTGGGWIMYQRRVNGTENFTKTWDEYKLGFGHNGGNTTELWLGNENVYQLVQIQGAKTFTLRIEADAFDGTQCWIEADNFTLSNETSLYTIDWNRGTSSSAKLPMNNAWRTHQNTTFKTFDKVGGQQACLNDFKGGWWYTGGGQCGGVLMNGEYLNSPQPDRTSIHIASFKPSSLRRSRMMFRERNYVHACNNPCKNNATCVHVDNPRGHRCVCKTDFCGPECEWKNPCKNNGTCEYRKTTNSTTCKCSAEFCGPECELKNPCKNNGTCEYRKTTNSTTCKCSAVFCGPECELKNPCNNGGTCEYNKTTNSTTCKCSAEFCGPECELKNPCKNNGTCEYRKTTNSTTCKCSAEFVGPKCEDAVTTPPTTPTTTPSTMPPTDPPTTIMPVVGGILLLLILCGIGIAAGVIYKRRQRKKQEEEEEKAKEEEAKEKLKLDEAEQAESESYLSIFGC